MSEHYREVFGEVLADHHEAPRNFGKIESPSRTEEGYNPVCGDQVKLFLKWKGENPEEQKILDELKFEGQGCSICMASASMMTEKVHGLSKQDVLKWIEGFRAKMQGGLDVGPLPTEDSGDDLVALYGIKRFPVRIKCALLPWTTLKKAVES